VSDYFEGGRRRASGERRNRSIHAAGCRTAGNSITTGVALNLQAGTVFAGHRIDELIGRGGMGVVYRATQLALERTVALKLVAPERAVDEGFRERFKRESRLAASIDHPHVITIFEAGESDGQLYVTMRFVDGTDLDELLAREGALRPAVRRRSSHRWPPPWTPRTPTASSTATSSRPTCCSRRPAGAITPS
jgi:serine/threonine protein kinase